MRKTISALLIASTQLAACAPPSQDPTNDGYTLDEVESTYDESGQNGTVGGAFWLGLIHLMTDIIQSSQTCRISGNGGYDRC